MGLDSIYDPPDVPGLAEDRTFYSYNLDRDLTQILRPDGLSVDFAYDVAGRVDAVTIPRGTVDYDYGATTGQLTGITAPGSETLSFAYDGSLPTAETWTATVSGQVGFAYDNDFRLSGLAVNGDTVAYGYDQNGLLTQAGDLALTRDPLNGLLTETTLDDVSTRQSYNAFGELAADSPREGVFGALEAIESESLLCSGLLRPADRLEKIFQPPSTKNPLRWLSFQMRSSDGLLELSWQVHKRLKQHGTVEEWGGRVYTVGDFVRAWWGAPRDTEQGDS